MEPDLGNEMEKLAAVLHWHGKYSDRNAVSLLARLVRSQGITSVDELAAWVDALPPPGPSRREGP